MYLERPLDAVEIRVLGALLEKQLATPDVYPLTLNSLVSACNQKSNRQPVMELAPGEIGKALQRLQGLQLVWEIHGGRVDHYDHRLDGRWGLSAPTRALMALLMLRGPQTAGELRARSERLFAFDSIEHAEGELRYLSQGDEPLVRELERRPGQKENRWTHLVGEHVEQSESLGAEPAPPTPVAESITRRLETLEESVEQLREELVTLRQALGE